MWLDDIVFVDVENYFYRWLSVNLKDRKTDADAVIDKTTDTGNNKKKNKNFEKFCYFLFHGRCELIV